MGAKYAKSKQMDAISRGITSTNSKVQQDQNKLKCPYGPRVQGHSKLRKGSKT